MIKDTRTKDRELLSKLEQELIRGYQAMAESDRKTAENYLHLSGEIWKSYEWIMQDFT